MYKNEATMAMNIALFKHKNILYNSNLKLNFLWSKLSQ